MVALSPAEHWTPVCTLGILGGGQLGRMLAQAALPLGIRCIFLEDDPHCPAAALGPVYGSDQLADFAAACDVLTTEFENTPLSQVDQLATLGRTLQPPRQALATAQNRIQEKTLFNQLDIPTPPWQAGTRRTVRHRATPRQAHPKPRSCRTRAPTP